MCRICNINRLKIKSHILLCCWNNWLTLRGHLLAYLYLLCSHKQRTCSKYYPYTLDCYLSTRFLWIRLRVWIAKYEICEMFHLYTMITCMIIYSCVTACSVVYHVNSQRQHYGDLVKLSTSNPVIHILATLSNIE